MSNIGVGTTSDIPLHNLDRTTTLHAWYRDEPPLREKLAEFHAESLDCPLQVRYGGELYGLYPQKVLLQDTLTGAPAKAYAAACSTVAIIANAATGNLLGAVLDTGLICIAPTIIASQLSEYTEEALAAAAGIRLLAGVRGADVAITSDLIDTVHEVRELLGKMKESSIRDLKEQLEGVRRIDDLAGKSIGLESLYSTTFTVDNEDVKVWAALLDKEKRNEIAELDDVTKMALDKLSQGERLKSGELEKVKTAFKTVKEAIQGNAEKRKSVQNIENIDYRRLKGLYTNRLVDDDTIKAITGLHPRELEILERRISRLSRYSRLADKLSAFRGRPGARVAGTLERVKETFGTTVVVPILAMTAGTIAAWTAASMEKENYHTIEIDLEDGCTPIEVSPTWIKCTSEDTTQTQGQEGGETGEEAGGTQGEDITENIAKITEEAVEEIEKVRKWAVESLAKITEEFKENIANITQGQGEEEAEGGGNIGGITQPPIELE